MARKPPRKRLLATHVSRVPGKRFRGLVLRRLEDGGLLGDVSIIHEHLPPRTELPTVHHKRTAEFVFCISGVLTAVLGGRKHRLRAGSVLLIPPGVRHKFVTAARSCDSISIFSPALGLAPGADIHTE
jgi:mannose-6-phosphate isomerase-like protein (cupin superfamily)